MSGSWEHLQHVISQVHNRIVRDDFPDVQQLNDDDISVARSSLRSACLVRDSDSAVMVLNRFFLFYVMLGKASDFHPPMYTIPSDRYQQLVRFAPQVTLYFKEDLDDVDEGYAPLDAEISFRLMNETAQTLTKADLTTLANKLRSEFATGGGYRWQKGRIMLAYHDPERGYHLQINAFSEAIGRQVINKVLDIQNHAIDSSKLTINQLAETPPIAPPMQTILGKSRRKPRKRPVGYVRFIYAELHIHGIPEAITLLDRSGRRRNPVVAA